VSNFQSNGSAPVFLLGGGNGHWLLVLDETHPGLSWQEGGARGKLLSLHSLAGIGRCDEAAFGRNALIGVAQHRGRVEATFVPPGWRGLRVRAAWSTAPVGEGVDLEVQIQAATAEVLERIEVGILSQWGDESAGPSNIRVEPRDAHAAALSYDGRESPQILQSLTTLPIPSSSPHFLAPRIVTPTGFGQDVGYVEMVQPNDCARRICRGPADERQKTPNWLATRYALFGHDLEKGVVLRARLRGLWIRSQSLESDAQASYEAFLREPPALGP
jgi:hypothetical protein